ncbi:MAG TPA: TfoX/Sxy family protein [Gammaproteobacteria bacterium]|nr:TfoX/Sxy family protein [Gammaproteobacteria bacterium]
MARLRRLLSRRRGVTEKRMIGGVCFLKDGQMACGVNAEGLLIRVGPEAREKFLAKPHVKPMRFAGKALSGYVLVEPAGIKTDAALKRWLQVGLAFVAKTPQEKTVSRMAKRKPTRR